MRQEKSLHNNIRFLNFYHNFLKNKLPELETNRKKVLKSRFIIFILSPICAALVFWLICTTGNIGTYDITHSPFTWVFIFLTIQGAVTCLFLAIFKCTLFNIPKNNFIEELFMYISLAPENLKKTKDNYHINDYMNTEYISCNMTFFILYVLLAFVLFLYTIHIIFLILVGISFLPYTIKYPLCVILAIILLPGSLCFLFKKLKSLSLADKRRAECKLFKYGILGFFTRLGYRDDHFLGIYRGLKIRLQEFVFMPNHRIVILDLKCPKYSKATITLKNKNFLFPQVSGDKITLESPEYEKYYTTYASGSGLNKNNIQVEARYILTTAFIERITELAKQGIEIACCFDLHNAYILVKAKKNLFEFPLFKSILKDEGFLYPLWEIKEVLSIIDTLKLDENIGL